MGWSQLSSQSALKDCYDLEITVLDFSFSWAGAASKIACSGQESYYPTRTLSHFHFLALNLFTRLLGVWPIRIPCPTRLRRCSFLCFIFRPPSFHCNVCLNMWIAKWSNSILRLSLRQNTSSHDNRSGLVEKREHTRSSGYPRSDATRGPPPMLLKASIELRVRALRMSSDLGLILRFHLLRQSFLTALKKL